MFKVGDFVYYQNPALPDGHVGAIGYGRIIKIEQEDFSRRYDPQKISTYVIVENMYEQDGTVCSWARGHKHKVPIQFIKSAKNIYENRINELKREMERLNDIYNREIKDMYSKEDVQCLQ